MTTNNDSRFRQTGMPVPGFWISRVWVLTLLMGLGTTIARSQTSLNVSIQGSELDTLLWQYRETAPVFHDLGITLTQVPQNEAQLILLEASNIAQEANLCVVTGIHHQTWILRSYAAYPTEENAVFTIGTVDDHWTGILAKFPGVSQGQEEGSWQLLPAIEGMTPVTLTIQHCDGFGDLRNQIRKKKVDAVLALEQIVDLLPKPDDSLLPDQHVERHYCWCINEQNPIASEELYHFVKGCILLTQRVQPSKSFHSYMRDLLKNRYKLSRKDARSLQENFSAGNYFQPGARIPKTEHLPQDTCVNTHAYEMALRLVPRRPQSMEIQKIRPENDDQ